MSTGKDAIGLAILDFERTGADADIVVSSDLCDDDVIPVAYLFRTFDQMPALEKTALELCDGHVLDVGAGAGCHAKILVQRGLQVHALDTSAGSINYLTRHQISASQKTIFELDNQQFDTILILMNGLGLAGSMAELPAFLAQLKKLLKPGGKILCDSSDVIYLYEDEDGETWLDMNAGYYGEMQFNMQYKTEATGWFPWLYIDFENLSDQAERAGLKCTFIFEGENNHYLVSLEHL